MQIRKWFSLLLFCFLPISAQSNNGENTNEKNNNISVISTLSRKDAVFQRYSSEVEEGYKWISRPNGDYAIQLYMYAPQSKDNIIKIAAKLGISYDTLASVNSLENNADLSAVDAIYFPNITGLFSLKEDADLGDAIPLSIPSASGTLVSGYFYPGRRFRGEKRNEFLDKKFIFPVKGGEDFITSQYGNRLDPFTKKWRLHEGLDIGKPVGTPVLAAKSGTVTKITYDSVYGNTITLKHDNYTTSYSHLQDNSTLFKVGDKVKTGQQIASVGNTGKSTGPHLHFMIYENGRVINPNKVLKFK